MKVYIVSATQLLGTPDLFVFNAKVAAESKLIELKESGIDGNLKLLEKEVK